MKFQFITLEREAYYEGITVANNPKPAAPRINEYCNTPQSHGVSEVASAISNDLMQRFSAEDMCDIIRTVKWLMLQDSEKNIAEKEMSLEGAKIRHKIIFEI